MTRLCDLSGDANTVTSVSWSERGHQLAVGTHHGYVTVWDVLGNKQVKISKFIKIMSNYYNITVPTGQQITRPFSSCWCSCLEQ